MKCSVCKENIPKGMGKMLVKNDGSIHYFCTPKCQKNWQMGRRMKWATKQKKIKKATSTASGKSAQSKPAR